MENLEVDGEGLIRVKAVLHFNRIVPKRSVFLFFLSDSVELMTLTQKKMLRYVTIRLKWKTGFTVCARIVNTRMGKENKGTNVI